MTKGVAARLHPAGHSFGSCAAFGVFPVCPDLLFASYCRICLFLSGVFLATPRTRRATMTWSNNIASILSCAAFVWRTSGVIPYFSKRPMTFFLPFGL